MQVANKCPQSCRGFLTPFYIKLKLLWLHNLLVVANSPQGFILCHWLQGTYLDTPVFPNSLSGLLWCSDLHTWSKSPTFAPIGRTSSSVSSYASTFFSEVRWSSVSSPRHYPRQLFWAPQRRRIAGPGQLWLWGTYFSRERYYFHPRFRDCWAHICCIICCVTGMRCQQLPASVFKLFGR